VIATALWTIAIGSGDGKIFDTISGWKHQVGVAKISSRNAFPQNGTQVEAAKIPYRLHSTCESRSHQRTKAKPLIIESYKTVVETRPGVPNFTVTHLVVSPCSPTQGLSTAPRTTNLHSTYDQQRHRHAADLIQARRGAMQSLTTTGSRPT
jgi:hypothetical protein